jgi:hypothetical protein
MAYVRVGPLAVKLINGVVLEQSPATGVGAGCRLHFGCVDLCKPSLRMQLRFQCTHVSGGQVATTHTAHVVQAVARHTVRNNLCHIWESWKSLHLLSVSV